MNQEPTDNNQSIVEDAIRIVKSTRTLTITHMSLAALAMMATILMARHLGVERFGVLIVALATVGLLNIFNDLGLSTLTVRDIAQDRSKLGHNLSYVGSLIILLSVCTSLFIIVVFSFSGYSNETKWVYWLLGVKVGIDGITLYLRSIFRAAEEMVYFSIATLTEPAARVVGIILAVLLSASLIPIVIVHLAASLFAFFVALFILITRFERPHLRISFRIWVDLLKRASPFAAYTVFNIVFSRADVALVGLFLGSVAAGLYGAAYRVYSMPLLLVVAIRQSMFPRFSAIAGSGMHERTQKLLDTALRYTFALSLPISIGTIFLADPIITFCFSEKYATANVALKILAVGFVPAFARSVLGSVAIANNKEKGQTIIFGACVALNVLLNLWLVPLYGHIGAAVANTVFLAVYCISLFLYVYSFLKSIVLWGRMVKALVAGAALSVCLLLLQRAGMTSLWISTLVGGFIYSVILYTIGFFSEKEKQIIWGAIHQYMLSSRAVLKKTWKKT